MAKKKGLSYEEKLLIALKKLPYILLDKKHGIIIKFINNQARSNESRFDHIILLRHGLNISDIERIPKALNNSTLRKDKERKDTYNLYIKRNNISDEYIKLSLNIEFKRSNVATVKTIFITKNFK